MPHINVIFVEDESTKQLLQTHKFDIRYAVALCTGYPIHEVALIPHMIPSSIAELADNLLPLEFAIDVGIRCAGQTEQINAKLSLALLKDVPKLASMNFGIWLRTMVDNDFIECKPK